MATAITLVVLVSTFIATLPTSLALALDIAGPLPYNASGFVPWNASNLLDLFDNWGNLSVDFHSESCPNLDGLMRQRMFIELLGDRSLAPALIRLYFNDCFPQGCDASILLMRPFNEEAYEQNAYISRKARDLIETLRGEIHTSCGPVVSCADILALAAREAVVFVGGTEIPMPPGRLDSLATASSSDVSAIPLPNTAEIAPMLSNPGDLVVFSGAHSVGTEHCTSIGDRIDRPDDEFSRKLLEWCRRDILRPLNLVGITPETLDNQYYVNLLRRQALFTSDLALVNDRGTPSWVQVYSNPKNKERFLRDFSSEMARLINTRSGRGEIRRFSCCTPNSWHAAASA